MILSYIDPAMGSMLLQAIAAIVLAGGVFFRRIIFSPFSFLSQKKSTDLSENADE